MKKTLTTGALYISLSSMIFMISGYVVNLWLGRSLGPVEYGIYGVVVSVMSMVNIIQTSGMPRSLSKFIAEKKSNRRLLLKSAFSLQIVSSLALSVFLFLISDLLAQLLNDPGLSKYIKFSCLIFPVYGIYSLYLGYYNGMRNFKKQSILTGAYSISKLVAVIILTKYYHLFGSIGGFIVAPLITLFIGIELPSIGKLWAGYKKLIYFSLPLISFAFFSTFQQSVDLYLIKALSGEPSWVGFYTANQNIAKIPFFALSVFATILFPSISKSVSEKRPDITASIISRSIRYVLLVLIPITALLSATSHELLGILFSEKYLAGSESLAILIISFSFLTVFSILANILNGAGNPHKSAAISISGVVVSVIFCYLLIPKYGMSGAAYATGIGGVFVTVAASFQIIKMFDVLVSFFSVSKILLASSVIFIISKSLDMSLPVLLVWYPLSLIFYIIILVFAKELTKKDLGVVLSPLPDKFLRKLSKWTT
jgi:stage V sporulation protein B